MFVLSLWWEIVHLSCSEQLSRAAEARKMNQFDLTEVRDSVAEHRRWLSTEISTSRAIQRRWLAHVGALLTWLGLQMMTWGKMLHAASTISQLSDDGLIE